MHKLMANDRGVSMLILADWFFQNRGQPPANESGRSVERTFVWKERMASPTSVCVGSYQVDRVKGKVITTESAQRRQWYRKLTL